MNNNGEWVDFKKNLSLTINDSLDVAVAANLKLMDAKLIDPSINIAFTRLTWEEKKTAYIKFLNNFKFINKKYGNFNDKEFKILIERANKKLDNKSMNITEIEDINGEGIVSPKKDHCIDLADKNKNALSHASGANTRAEYPAKIYSLLCGQDYLSMQFTKPEGIYGVGEESMSRHLLNVDSSLEVLTETQNRGNFMILAAQVNILNKNYTAKKKKGDKDQETFLSMAKNYTKIARYLLANGRGGFVDLKLDENNDVDVEWLKAITDIHAPDEVKHEFKLENVKKENIIKISNYEGALENLKQKIRNKTDDKDKYEKEIYPQLISMASYFYTDEKKLKEVKAISTIYTSLLSEDKNNEAEFLNELNEAKKLILEDDNVFDIGKFNESFDKLNELGIKFTKNFFTKDNFKDQIKDGNLLKKLIAIKNGYNFTTGNVAYPGDDAKDKKTELEFIDCKNNDALQLLLKKIEIQDFIAKNGINKDNIDAKIKELAEAITDFHLKYKKYQKITSSTIEFGEKGELEYDNVIQQINKHLEEYQDELLKKAKDLQNKDDGSVLTNKEIEKYVKILDEDGIEHVKRQMRLDAAEKLAKKSKTITITKGGNSESILKEKFIEMVKKYDLLDNIEIDEEDAKVSLKAEVDKQWNLFVQSSALVRDKVNNNTMYIIKLFLALLLLAVCAAIVTVYYKYKHALDVEIAQGLSNGNAGIDSDPLDPTSVAGDTPHFSQKKFNEMVDAYGVISEGETPSTSKGLNVDLTLTTTNEENVTTTNKENWFTKGGELKLDKEIIFDGSNYGETKLSNGELLGDYMKSRYDSDNKTVDVSNLKNDIEADITKIQSQQKTLLQDFKKAEAVLKTPATTPKLHNDNLRKVAEGLGVDISKINKNYTLQKQNGMMENIIADNLKVKQEEYNNLAISEESLTKFISDKKNEEGTEVISSAKLDGLVGSVASTNAAIEASSAGVRALTAVTSIIPTLAAIFLVFKSVKYIRNADTTKTRLIKELAKMQEEGVQIVATDGLIKKGSWFVKNLSNATANGKQQLQIEIAKDTILQKDLEIFENLLIFDDKQEDCKQAIEKMKGVFTPSNNSKTADLHSFFADNQKVIGAVEDLDALWQSPRPEPKTKGKEGEAESKRTPTIFRDAIDQLFGAEFYFEKHVQKGDKALTPQQVAVVMSQFLSRKIFSKNYTDLTPKQKSMVAAYMSLEKVGFKKAIDKGLLNIANENKSDNIDDKIANDYSVNRANNGIVAAVNLLGKAEKYQVEQWQIQQSLYTGEGDIKKLSKTPKEIAHNNSNNFIKNYLDRILPFGDETNRNNSASEYVFASLEKVLNNEVINDFQNKYFNDNPSQYKVSEAIVDANGVPIKKDTFYNLIFKAQREDEKINTLYQTLASKPDDYVVCFDFPAVGKLGPKLLIQKLLQFNKEHAGIISSELIKLLKEDKCTNDQLSKILLVILNRIDMWVYDQKGTEKRTEKLRNDLKHQKRTEKRTEKLRNDLKREIINLDEQIVITKKDLFASGANEGDIKHFVKTNILNNPFEITKLQYNITEEEIVKLVYGLDLVTLTALLGKQFNGLQVAVDGVKWKAGQDKEPVDDNLTPANFKDKIDSQEGRTWIRKNVLSNPQLLNNILLNGVIATITNAAELKTLLGESVGNAPLFTSLQTASGGAFDDTKIQTQLRGEKVMQAIIGNPEIYNKFLPKAIGLDANKIFTPNQNFGKNAIGCESGAKAMKKYIHLQQAKPDAIIQKSDGTIQTIDVDSRFIFETLQGLNEMNLSKEFAARNNSIKVEDDDDEKIYFVKNHAKNNDEKTFYKKVINRLILGNGGVENFTQVKIPKSGFWSKFVDSKILGKSSLRELWGSTTHAEAPFWTQWTAPSFFAKLFNVKQQSSRAWNILHIFTLITFPFKFAWLLIYTVFSFVDAGFSNLFLNPKTPKTIKEIVEIQKGAKDKIEIIKKAEMKPSTTEKLCAQLFGAETGNKEYHNKGYFARMKEIDINFHWSLALCALPFIFITRAISLLYGCGYISAPSYIKKMKSKVGNVVYGLVSATATILLLPLTVFVKCWVALYRWLVDENPGSLPGSLFDKRIGDTDKTTRNLREKAADKCVDWSTLKNDLIAKLKDSSLKTHYQAAAPEKINVIENTNKSLNESFVANVKNNVADTKRLDVYPQPYFAISQNKDKSNDKTQSMINTNDVGLEF